MRLASTGKENGKFGPGDRNRTASMRNTMGIALAGGELFPRTCLAGVGESGKTLNRIRAAVFYGHPGNK